MKTLLYFAIAFLLINFAGHLAASAQEPDLSKLNTDKDKIKAWAAYCESLRLNTSSIKNNYFVLQLAALKGLTMLKEDDFENKAKFFSYTALGYYYQQKFDSAQYFFYESLHTAQKGNLVRPITSACLALIPVNFQLQQKDKVEECKNILQSIADTAHNPSLLKDIYYGLGNYYQQKSYYSTAQDYFIKSIELREKEVDTAKDVKTKFDYAIQCDLLSKLYLNTQMVDKSLHALRQGERFADVSPNVSNRLLSSFVEAFTTSGNIDSALYYNSRLEKQIANSPVFPSEIVSSSLNIAIYYIDHKQYSRALPFLTRGDTIANRIQSPLLIFQTQMIKGRYLEETGKYDEALVLLMQSLPVAKQFSRELYSSILKNIALAQKGKGNTAVALQYYEQYAEQADSLTKEKLSINFADQETRYETNQKEQHIASLDKENRLNILELQNATRTRLFLVLGLAALGIISLLLYLIYRNKEKVNKVLNTQNDQLETLNSQLGIANDTKAKLFGIIGHDLRSPASQIVQLLQVQKERPELLTEQSRRQHEERLKAASENVLETMEDILLWSKSQMQNFTPQFRKTSIAETVEKEIHFLQQRIEEKNLILDNKVAENFMQDTDENFVSVIIRNLLQNAVKYSDAGNTIAIANTPNELQITNQSSQSSAETLNALLQNKQVNSKTSGFGLQIANDLATSIKAKILFERNDDSHLTAVLSWKK
ncbi:MAG: HAMP domain-containing sensor histidine kinase [Bacteroidota bacterium]